MWSILDVSRPRCTKLSYITYLYLFFQIDPKVIFFFFKENGVNLSFTIKKWYEKEKKIVKK